MLERMELILSGPNTTPEHKIQLCHGYAVTVPPFNYVELLTNATPLQSLVFIRWLQTKTFVYDYLTVKRDLWLLIADRMWTWYREWGEHDN